MRRGAQIIQRSRQHLKILGTRRVKCFKCHAEDPFMFGFTVQNPVAMATLRPGFVHPWLCVWPICLPKYVMTSVHYVRHHTRDIQTSLAAILLVYIINFASVWKVCYLLSAIQYFGTNIKWRWYRSQLTRKLVYHVLTMQKIIQERDSNGITVNQGFEKIRAWFKSCKARERERRARTHTHARTHAHTHTHTHTHTTVISLTNVLSFKLWRKKFVCATYLENQFVPHRMYTVSSLWLSVNAVWRKWLLYNLIIRINIGCTFCQQLWFKAVVRKLFSCRPLRYELFVDVPRRIFQSIVYSVY